MSSFLEYHYKRLLDEGLISEMPHIPEPNGTHQVGGLSNNDPMFITHKGLALYKPLGEIKTGNNEQLFLYIDKSEFTIYGTMPHINPRNNQESNLVKFIMRFKIPTYKSDLNHLFGNDEWRPWKQVNSVATFEGMNGQGIGYAVYALLVKRGDIIVSDNTQFNPAKNLWKSIARDIGLDYVVNVIGVDNQFIKDNNGDPVKYDGKNIPDEKIWSYGKDESNKNVLLVLRKK